MASGRARAGYVLTSEPATDMATDAEPNDAVLDWSSMR